MYRHIAESIKESKQKRFLSRDDIAKYESYPDKFVNREDVYNKEEFDNVMSELQTVFAHVDGQNLGIAETKRGSISNLNIKGCTVQNPQNLEDIQSVGFDTGDGTYRLGFKCVGKNIFDGMIEHEGKYYYFENGRIDINPDYNSYIVRVHPDTTYFLSYEIELDVIHPCSNITYWDKDMNFLGGRAEDGRFTTPNNCRFIRFAGHKQCENIQIEKGVLATEYEAYKEEVTSLILPCELMSVNDTRDRVFKRHDGIWCIEKNIKHMELAGNEKWGQRTPGEGTVRFKLTIDNICYDKKKLGIISNKFQNYDFSTFYNANMEGVSVMNDQPAIHVRVEESKLESLDNAGINKWMKANGVVFIFILEQPEIIELPLETQIKLNTYEGMTNIFSFNTKVEPFISGTISKSIGGTVKGLQDQISDLTTKLKTVENLEKSTTVKYESNVADIVVKDSTNGAIDNVNVKGKTLINVLQRGFKDHDNKVNAYQKLSGTLLEDGYVKLEYTDVYDKQAFRHLSQTPLKVNTQYTLIFEVLECNITGADNLHVIYPISNPNSEGYQNDSAFKETWGLYARECTPGSIHTKLVNTKESFENIKYGMRSYLRYLEGASGYISFRLMLLEGDHTQNPPTYFEGIKSVGETSGLTIHSRNESKNLFDINNFSKMTYSYYIPQEVNEQNKDVQYRVINDTIDILIPGNVASRNYGVGGAYKVEKNKKYNITCQYAHCNQAQGLNIRVIGIYEKDVDKKLGLTEESANRYMYRLETKTIQNGGSCTVEYNTKDYDYIVVFIGGNYVTNPTEMRRIKLRGISISKVENKLDLTHESMVKRIIYKDNNGNFVELDSLKSTGYLSDTIEKHSNGKYYLHKRCGQMLLTGNEHWTKVIPEYQPESTELVAFNNHKVKDTDVLLDNKYNMPLCDKFITVGNNDKFYTEGIKYHSTDKRIRLAIRKDKLVSEDTNGLKAWLVDNNINIIYELKHEEVYEVVSLNVNLYEGDTGVYIESLPVKPELSITANKFIGGIVNDLKERTTALESNIIEQITTQNRLLLSSAYSADRSGLKAEIAIVSNYKSNEMVDYNIYNLIRENILSGIYDVYEMEEIIDFYTMIGKLDFDMADALFSILSY